MRVPSLPLRRLDLVQATITPRRTLRPPPPTPLLRRRFSSMIRIGNSRELTAQSARHHLTLRDRRSGDYHSLLLFSFPKAPRCVDADAVAEVAVPSTRWYCMEASCPHLGAPLENAPLQTMERGHPTGAREVVGEEDEVDVSFQEELAAAERLGKQSCGTAGGHGGGVGGGGGGGGTASGHEAGEDIDDIEDAVIVCPWHEYDFSLATGESSTGLQACTYRVEERGAGEVWVEPPRRMSTAPAGQEDVHEGQGGAATTASEGEDGAWELVQLRAVTEAHAPLHPPKESSDLECTFSRSVKLDASARPNPSGASAAPQEIAYPDPAPRTLVAWACLVLRTPEPRAKVQLTRWAAQAFRTGECKVVGGGRWASTASQQLREEGQPSPAATTGEGKREERQWYRRDDEVPPQVPPRTELQVVQPGQEGKRGKGGTEKSRIALLHSLANIELWAIDLAMDVIARAAHLSSVQLSPRSRLPVQFYSDFLRIAEDEAKHFSLLNRRLHEMGSSFGQLPVHHGLWDSALTTMHSLTARLSVIHLVHEARGLDVNPITIKKFAKAGDAGSVEVLTTIHLDEITHVSAGHRWLTWMCAQMEPAREPRDVFRDEVRDNFRGRLKGPFNAADRAKAGLDRAWYSADVLPNASGFVKKPPNEISRAT